MSYNKIKFKQVTIYVPHEIIIEIDKFHANQGRPHMKRSAQIVNLLQIWYDEKFAEEGRGGQEIASEE